MLYMIDMPDMEEKPSACYDCPFGYSGLVGGECLVNGERLDDLREVPEWCPLTQVDRFEPGELAKMVNSLLDLPRLSTLGEADA